MSELYLRLLNEMFSFESLESIHLGVVIISYGSEESSCAKGSKNSTHFFTSTNKQISLKVLRPFLTLHFLYSNKTLRFIVAPAEKRG